MQNKKCNVCLEIKPLSEFYIRMGNYRIDGTFKYYARTKCKRCDDAKRKEWRKANIEKSIKYRHEYYLSHK